MESDRIYCIYCYTNKINNKKYIGQSKDVNRRCHPSNYKGCTKFYHAIQKYGWENFERTILAENLTINEANLLEEKLISQFDTINHGYNIKSGGLNNTYSQESKEKMRNSSKSKRKIICLETLQVYESTMDIQRTLGFACSNISACCKGKLHSAYGYHWAYYEDYENNNLPDYTDPRKRKVFCVELNKMFNSLSEAERETGVNHSNIVACCQKRLKTTGGFHWEYGN